MARERHSPEWRGGNRPPQDEDQQWELFGTIGATIFQLADLWGMRIEALRGKSLVSTLSLLLSEGYIRERSAGWHPRGPHVVVRLLLKGRSS